MLANFAELRIQNPIMHLFTPPSFQRAERLQPIKGQDGVPQALNDRPATTTRCAGGGDRPDPRASPQREVPLALPNSRILQTSLPALKDAISTSEIHLG